MRAAGAGMDVQRKHLRPAPGEDLDLWHEPGADPVADEVGQAFFQIERFGNPPNVPALVLHADQQRPARGVGKGHDRLARLVGRGEVPLELQRLTLRALEDFEQAL